MTWTTDKPTKQGWYWYREMPTSPAHPVKVFGPKLFYVWPMDDLAKDNETKDIGDCHGEFAGPMEPPA
jgi:hypothetical protein